jgi:hypothetical protein
VAAFEVDAAVGLRTTLVLLRASHRQPAFSSWKGTWMEYTISRSSALGPSNMTSIGTNGTSGRGTRFKARMKNSNMVNLLSARRQISNHFGTGQTERR